MRKRQYLIVTDNLKNKSISEIVKDLKEKNSDFIWQCTVVSQLKSKSCRK